MQVITPDVQATQALGEALGRVLGANAVVALDGDLGAGKTALAQGIARGLGVIGPVVSPTFALCVVYDEARLPFVHVDFYRVERAEELDQLGLDEAFDGAVAVVEWASLFPAALPEDHLAVRIEEVPGGRRLTLTATGARHAGWLGALHG